VDLYLQSPLYNFMACKGITSVSKGFDVRPLYASEVHSGPAVVTGVEAACAGVQSQWWGTKCCVTPGHPVDGIALMNNSRK
jgi:hypothetical protein